MDLSFFKKLSRLGILVCLIFTCYQGFGQTNIWVFGGANYINFNTQPPSLGVYQELIDNSNRVTDYGHQNAVFTRGDSILYYGSEFLFNSEFQKINEFHPKTNRGKDITIGLNQNSCGVFLPSSEDTNIVNYVAVSESAGLDTLTDFDKHYTNLQVFTINNSINGGLGGSNDGSTRTDLFNQLTTEHIALSSGCKPDQVWLIARAWESNEFIVWDTRNSNPKDWPTVISKPNGPNVYNPRSFNETLGNYGAENGYMKVNQDGVLVFTTLEFDSESNAKPISLYQFDKSSGVVDYLFDLDLENNALAYGVEFSTNGQYLYVSVEYRESYQSVDHDSTHIYQYDVSILEKQAVMSSQISVFKDDFSTTRASLRGLLQRAPNNEIFVANFAQNYFDIIRNPNERGVLCGYEHKALEYDGGRGGFNFPILYPTLNQARLTIINNDICLGETLDIVVSFSGSVKEAELIIQNEKYIVNAPLDTVSIKFDSVGSYTIKLTNSNNCALDTLCDTITVAEPFQFTLPNDTILCVGDTHQLMPILSDATGQDQLTYLWHDGTTLPYYNTWDTSKWVMLTLSNGCGLLTDSVFVQVDLPLERTLPIDTIGCGEILTLTVPTWSGATVEWSTGDNTIATTVSDSGLVTVTGLNACGVFNDSSLVQFKEAPIYPAISDTMWCSEEALIIELPITEDETILWDNEVPSPSYNITGGGMHTVEVTNVCGVWRDTFEVIKIDPPTVNLGNDTILCNGERLTLSLPKDTLDVLWSDGSIVDTLVIDTAGVYTVQVSNVCYASMDTIVVEYYAVPTTNLADTVAACVNDFGVFTIDSAVGITTWTYLKEEKKFDAVTYIAIRSSYVTVVYQDEFECAFVDSVYFEVYPLPIALVGADDTICTGDSVRLNAQGGIIYQWSPAAGLSNDTIANPWASPENTTIYSVEVTDVNGCQALDSIAVVNGNETGVAIRTDDLAVCSNESDTVIIEINAAITTYDWVYPDSAAFVSDSVVAVFPKMDAFFILRGRNVLGCKSRDSIFINALSLPDTVFPKRDSACFGEQLVYNYPNTQSLVITPTDQVTVQGDAVIFDVLNNIDYAWRFTTTEGCSIRDTFSLSVNHPDSVELPNSIMSCSLDSVTIGYTASVFSSEWRFGLDSFINTDTITFLPTTSAPLTLQATSKAGCEALFSVSIIVNERPIIELEDSLYACAGDTIDLLCTNCSAGEMDWRTGENVYLENDNPKRLIARQSGFIQLILTDDKGCTSTDSFFLEVAVPQGLSHFNDTSICKGDTIAYSLSLDNPIIVTGENFSQSDTQLLLYPITSSIYFIKSEDTVCAASIALKVDLDSLDYTIADSLTICAGDTTRMILEAENVTYNWSPADVLDSSMIQNPRTFPVSSQTITVAMVNDNGCVFEDSTHIQVLPNNGLTVPIQTIASCQGDTAIIPFSLSDGLELNVTATQPFEVIGDSVYVYTDTSTSLLLATENDNGCQQIIPVNILVNDTPSIAIDGPLALCSNEDAIVTLSPSSTFTIIPDPINAINDSQFTLSPGILYSITATTAAGCSSMTTYEIESNPIPSIAVAALDSIICTDEQAIFSLFGAEQWDWLPKNTDDEIRGDTLFLSATNTTAYTVIGIGDSGCADSVQVAVTVVDYGEPMLTILPPEGICIGDSLFLSVSGGTSYSWAGLIPGDCPDCSSGFAKPQASGEATVTITRAECTAIVITEPFTVNALPQLSVDSVIMAEIGNDIPLSAQSTLIPMWSAEVNELACFQCLQNTLLNVMANDFVYVTVEDDIGCVTTDTIQIIVDNECATALLPNAFTPNQDGLNDQLEVLFTPGSQPNFQFMRVWNRWGEMVFETESLTELWTGNSSPVGVYQVEVQLDCFGDPSVITGGVQLIR